MGLSTISEQFKKVVIWLGIGLAALAIIWIVWLLLAFVWGLIFPPAPPGPDFRFGKISAPFTSNLVAGSTTFQLDTPGGQLPANPSMLPVYVVPNLEGKFASLDSGKKIASSGGLDSEPTKLSEFEWSWTSKKSPNKSLHLNIVTNNFTYNYDWSADPSSLVGVFKTNENKITADARSLIGNFSSLKSDLKKGPTRVAFLKLIGKERNKVGSFSEANATLVEFYRSDISYKNKSYPVVEPDPNLALVNVLISPVANEKRLLELNFTYFNFDAKQVGTYSIKTFSQAYQDLKSEKAFVPNNNLVFDTVTITKASLGYLNPNSTNIRYLEPVYVFEGESVVNDTKTSFLAYVLAVTDDYIK